MNETAPLPAHAKAIFEAGVEAADPADAVRNALRARQSNLEAAEGVVLVAFGKGAMAMARAALPFVAAKLKTGVVVTTRETAVPIDGLLVHAAGHPTPDEGSARGAVAIETALDAAGPADLVLVLVSGGGSALVCAPKDGLTLADKITANDILVACGAAIDEINTVRRRLSRLKGGGLLARAAPARVLSLILSDVPGDDPSAIASGPSVPCEDEPGAADAVVRRYGLDDRLPENVLAAIRREDGGPSPVTPGFETVIVGSNAISRQAAAERAAALGYRIESIEDWLAGDVSDAARRMHRIARHAAASGESVAVIAGGETTVALKGTGLGGRNQELALRFALLAETAPPEGDWLFLSAGTDGRDGPTDAAGAMVDAGTLATMRQAGLDPAARLADNDSHPALAAAGSLLRIGATGTNVADLQIFLKQGSAANPSSSSR